MTVAQDKIVAKCKALCIIQLDGNGNRTCTCRSVSQCVPAAWKVFEVRAHAELKQEALAATK